MSLCMICSTCLSCDGDILCKKHHAEFLKMEAAIRSGAKKPPFGLLEAAFMEKTFAEIGSIIWWGNAKSSSVSSEEIEDKIKKIVNERNREVLLRANTDADLEKAQKMNELAATLGVSLTRG